jgi:hypothetical protein
VVIKYMKSWTSWTHDSDGMRAGFGESAVLRGHPPLPLSAAFSEVPLMMRLYFQVHNEHQGTNSSVGDCIKKILFYGGLVILARSTMF